jgi:hypothetical protein
VIVYAVVDESLSPTSRSATRSRVFVRLEEAERFIEEVRGDDPERREPVNGLQPAIRSSAPSVRAGRRANPSAILAQGQPDVAFIGHQRLDGCFE